MDDEVLTLEQLCKTYWHSKTPNAIRTDICRGENYPFLFKLGGIWTTRLGEWKKWIQTQERNQQTRR